MWLISRREPHGEIGVGVKYYQDNLLCRVAVIVDSPKEAAKYLTKETGLNITTQMVKNEIFNIILSKSWNLNEQS